jgi:hypothetical protein
MKVQNSECHVEVMGMCVPWKVASHVEKLFMQALQFQKIGV